MALSPTLWRTARVLAGETRLELLRRIINQPGQTVSELSRSLALSLPRASQELRRLQSRGLVQAVRKGLTVRYRPVPDPLVASARPILDALEQAFRASPPDNEPVRNTARAFSHEKRLAIVRELIRGPRSVYELQGLLRMPGMTAYRHLHQLENAGVIRRMNRQWELAATEDPLGACLVGLLKERPA